MKAPISCTFNSVSSITQKKNTIIIASDLAEIISDTFFAFQILLIRSEQWSPNVCADSVDSVLTATVECVYISGGPRKKRWIIIVSTFDSTVVANVVGACELNCHVHWGLRVTW